MTFRLKLLEVTSHTPKSSSEKQLLSMLPMVQEAQRRESSRSNSQAGWVDGFCEVPWLHEGWDCAGMTAESRATQ